MAVPSNLLNVTDNSFYIPTEMEKVSGVAKLPDGKIDAVGLLYSDEDLYTYPTYPGDNQDAYNIGVQYSTNYAKKGTSTRDMRMLLPYGLSGLMGLSAGDLVRWKTSSGGTNTYMATVRGLVTKMPGFYFSGLNVVALNAKALISMDDFTQFKDDCFGYNENNTERYANATEGYEFTDQIPKQSLFLKLNPDISD